MSEPETANQFREQFFGNDGDDSNWVYCGGHKVEERKDTEADGLRLRIDVLKDIANDHGVGPNDTIRYKAEHGEKTVVDEAVTHNKPSPIRFTIPKKNREKLGVEAGDEVLVYLDKHGPQSVTYEQTESEIELLRQIRDLLANEFAGGVSAYSDGYKCKECGKEFDSGAKLGGHISSSHREGGRGGGGNNYWTDKRGNGIMDERVEQILNTAQNIPADEFRSNMIKPFVDYDVSPYLTRMHEAGAVEREKADDKSFVYWLSDEAKDWLQERSE